ncbi:WGR domain-containing protein [Candidatus Methylocalor cossyra]|uniref:WGR domain-containing protein n=1 Tax=Candidatus Methylocalor cossyra TaxID=3108543 RepID=A0ABM9NMX7_9GAMM
MQPLRLRWEKHTRYYEVQVEPDLWGTWVLTRLWGRRGTALGQIRRMPCGSYDEALEQVAAVTRRRAQRGYAAVAVGQSSRLESSSATGSARPSPDGSTGPTR